MRQLHPQISSQSRGEMSSSLRRLLGGTQDPRGDESPGPAAQEVLTACTTVLSFLLLGFVSSLYFSISMCTPPLRIPTTPGNDFWPLYNIPHWSFSNGRLYPSPDFTGRNWAWEEATCCPGSPNKVPGSKGTTLQMGPSSHPMQPPPLWMLGCILHLFFTSLGRCKTALALGPTSIIPKPDLLSNSTISSLPIWHLQLERLVTTSLT